MGAEESLKQKIAIGVFWAAALIAYGVYTAQHGLTPLETLRRLSEYLAENPAGPLIFIVLYTLRPIFLFSAAVLSIGGGVLFGPIWGVIYTLVGSNLGATLAFFIGRFFGEGLNTDLGGWGDRMRKNSFESVFLMRLMFLPYDLVNYAAGFLRINYWAFLTATVLGSIPGTFSFTWFGASAGLDQGTPNFDWRVLAASVAIFLVSLGVSRWLKKKEGQEQE